MEEEIEVVPPQRAHRQSTRKPTNKIKKRSAKTPKAWHDFTADDDAWLASYWLCLPENHAAIPITRQNAQPPELRKVGAILTRFKQEYGVSMKQKHYKERVAQLLTDTLKFSTIYNNLNRESISLESNTPDLNLVAASKETYLQKHHNPFLFESAWYVLRDHPRWTMMGTGHQTQFQQRGVVPYHSETFFRWPSTTNNPGTPCNVPQSANLADLSSNRIKTSSRKRGFDELRDSCASFSNEIELGANGDKTTLDIQDRRGSTGSNEVRLEVLKVNRLQLEVKKLEAQTEYERMELDIMEKDVDGCTDEYEKEYFLVKKRKILTSLKAQESDQLAKHPTEKKPIV